MNRRLIDSVPVPQDNLAAVVIIAGILIGTMGITSGLMLVLRDVVQYFGGWQ